MISLNKIIDSISIAINDNFGDDYEIYTESVEQGLREPCFSIISLNATNNLFRGNKYFRRNQFCIQYFPSKNDKKYECNEILEELYDCLELIKLIDSDKTILGTKMNGEIIDGVLNFFVNYDTYVYKVEVEKEFMEDLKINNN